MLALPAKVAQALRHSTLQPVLYAEIVTSLLDDVIETYDQWTTAPSFLSEHRTQIKSEDGPTPPPAGTNPFAMLQLLFPAQGGDPIQALPGFDCSAAAADFGAIELLVQDHQPGVSPFQTFRISIGEQDIYQVSSLILRLKRVPHNARMDLRVEVTPAADPGDIFFGSLDRRNFWDIFLYRNAVFSEVVSSGSFGMGFEDVIFSFSPALTIQRDAQYRVRLMPGLFFIEGDRASDRVYWEGYRGRALKPWESSGFAAISAQGNTVGAVVPDQELFLRVNVPVYSFDGTTPGYREITHDFGRVPTHDGYFDFNYRTPADSKVRFRAWASATGAFAGEETALGAADAHTMALDGHDGAMAHVHDGDPITVLRRYYKLRVEPLGTSNPAQVTQSLLYTPSVHKVTAVFPDRVHAFCSGTEPVLGAIPAIVDIPGISTRLDVKGYAAQPQSFQLRLADLGGYASLPALEANLRNCPVELRLGFLGQSILRKADLAPYAGGKVVDYDFDGVAITINIQDRSKDLSLKLPAGRAVSGTIPALQFDGVHLVDVLDQLLFSEIRIPRRYKDAAAFAAAKSDLGAEWVTVRRIAEPTEARDLVMQLLEVIGYLLTTTEDGKLTLIRYPRSGTSVEPWDDDDILPGGTQLPSFESSIVNRCTVFWGYAAQGESQASSDFTGIAVAEDQTSQSEWAPGAGIYVADRQIKGYWLPGAAHGGAALGNAVAVRIVQHMKDGLITTRRSTSLGKVHIQVGDYIDLKTPIFLRKGYRGSTKVAQQFLVAAKTPHPSDGFIDFDLIEARDRNRPPKPAISVTPSVGTAPFSIAIDPTGTTDPDGDGILLYEVDPDFDGVNFQPDYATTTGAVIHHTYGVGTLGHKIVALRVKDARGLSGLITAEVRARGAPTAVIALETQTDPGQPLHAILSGAGSYSRSSQITSWAWCVPYDGSHFVITSRGVQTVISMPYRNTVVALQVADDDGFTDIATLTLEGKQLAPAAVANFLIQQQGDRITLSWSPVADLDLSGYQLRAKYEPTGSQTATWDTADVLTPDGSETIIKVTSIMLNAPRPYGNYSFFVKALDSSGNFSAVATSILANTSQPGDRFGILSRDEHDVASPAWSDTSHVSQLLFEASTERWWIGGESLIGDLADTALGSLADTAIGSLGTLYDSGTYTTETIDLGAIFSSARLSILPLVIYTGDPEQTGLLIEARIATTGAPTWGPWQRLSIADLTLRYLQVRITLQQFDGGSNVGLGTIKIAIDLPTVVQSKEDLNVAIGGTTWNFPVAFQVLPRVAFSIQNMGSTPLYLDVTAKSKTAVTVRVRNTLLGTDVGSNGVQVVDLTATGA